METRVQNAALILSSQSMQYNMLLRLIVPFIPYSCTSHFVAGLHSRSPRTCDRLTSMGYPFERGLSRKRGISFARHIRVAVLLAGLTAVL